MEEAQSYQKLEINEVNNQIVSGSGLRLRRPAITWRPAMTWRPGLVSGLCAVSGFTVVCSLINQVRIKHYTTCSDELSQTDNHITSSNVRTWFVPSHSEHLHCLTKLYLSPTLLSSLIPFAITRRNLMAAETCGKHWSSWPIYYWHNTPNSFQDTHSSLHVVCLRHFDMWVRASKVNNCCQFT